MTAAIKTDFGNRIRDQLSKFEETFYPLTKLRAFVKKSKNTLSTLGCDLAEVLLKHGYGQLHVSELFEMPWLELENSLQTNRSNEPTRASHLEEATKHIRQAADELRTDSRATKQLKHNDIMTMFESARELMEACIRHDIDAGMGDTQISYLYRTTKNRVATIRAEMLREQKKAS